MQDPQQLLQEKKLYETDEQELENKLIFLKNKIYVRQDASLNQTKAQDLCFCDVCNEHICTTEASELIYE